MIDPAIETLEIDLLQKAIADRYGYDFSNYSPASFKRRVVAYVKKSGHTRISDLIPPLLHDRNLFRSFLYAVSVTVTEMFRDPQVYKILREKVIPVLKTYPSIKVWHAGCATGEEAYSSAILFAEEGLADRVQIYATDINEESLHIASEGIYPIEKIKEYTQNYQQSGGRGSFSDYYHARYEAVIMNQDLRKRLTFSSHNLVSDGSFGAMHLIFCRNVLIYFDETLQNRALNLFSQSLVPKGFLCLGTKESLLFSTVKDRFRIIAEREKCFQLK
jgi:chemotaxis protein methyltransferase CheR